MDTIEGNNRSRRERIWQWFMHHADSPYALWWLAALSYSDALFFPIAPEVFLVALMLAHPKRWKQYLPVAIFSSVLGASTGYAIAVFLFRQFGAPILQFYGLGRAFVTARHLIMGHVFVAMSLASFTPIPDKVFIYAGGFLGVHFIPYITGYFVGRGVRMSLVTYLTGRFGKRILTIIDEYFLIVGCVLLALLLYYIGVHLI